MPRISFSISASVRRAPSMRVEAPVEVIKTDRLSRPKTCGLSRAPDIHCPFNSSILAILETKTEGIFSIRFEKLSDNCSVFVSFWPALSEAEWAFFGIYLIGHINYIQLYPIKKVWSIAFLKDCKYCHG